MAASSNLSSVVNSQSTPRNSTPTASFEARLVDLLRPRPMHSCSLMQASTQMPTSLVVAAYERRVVSVGRSWGVDGPPGATGVLSGRGGRKRGPPVRSSNEVIHLIQGCHCALLQKLCKMPKSQTLNP